ITGVASLTTPKSHSAGERVRWAWKLPNPVSGDNHADTATIVVDGDLNIQYNIFSIPPVNPGSVREIPTIAFIVRGDVTIDPAVTQVAGAFVVLGKDSALVPTDPAGRGQFSTGSDDALCDPTSKKCNPLKILGLLFARQFNFERTGDQKLASPGEQVTFDSNLLLNPPPGLEDLTKALPRITRVNQ
ncbi:MAG: hypothetical protein WC786_03640, partial [Patescibacteria group bacterium]